MGCNLRLGCIKGIYIKGCIVGCIKGILFFVLELYLPPSSFLLPHGAKRFEPNLSFTNHHGIF